jgi:pimeloyl-ACP methyl ester carboxylesterase
MIDVSHREKSCIVRGLSTAWLEAGTPGNPVVMLLHGFPDDASIWRPQMDALAAKFHIIAPHVRGCATSVPAQDLHRYGRDAVVLDHLSILSQCTSDQTPVLCVGHDLGVVHAMTLAQRLGPRCAGIVCINGLDLEMFARRLRDPEQIAKSWYMGFMQVPILPEMVARYAPRTAHWLAQTLAGGDSSHLAVPSEFERRAIAPLNQYRAFAREVGRTGSGSGRLKCPVLVVWGRDDGVLLPPTEQEWRRVALNASIRIIPGGHWLHRDQPDVVNDLLAQFAHSSLKVGES